MSKTTTTPAKKATTPARKASKSVPSKTLATRGKGVTPGKKTSATARKPAPKPTTKSVAATSVKSYKAKPNGNPTVNRRVSGLSCKNNPTDTVGLSKRSGSGKENPRVSAPAPSPEAPRPLFRRATVTLTASMDVPTGLQAHEEGHSSRETGAVAHKNAPEAHKSGDSSHGSPSGTSALPGVPPGHEAAPALAPAGTPAPPLKPLNDLEKKFAYEFAQDGNASRAYMRATGVTRETTAGTMGWRWSKRVEIRAQIDLELADLQKRAGVKTEDMLRRLWLMFTADARELVEHVVESCRYCHGRDGLYQRTDTELRRDRAEFAALGRQRIDGVYVGKRRKRADNDPAEEKEAFQGQGGGGFDPHIAPNPECGSCHGYGVTRAVFKDTRTLSPAAALLYQGIEETKEGLKVRFINQLDAFEKIAKHTGFYDADNRQKKPDDPFTAMLARISGPGAALPINPNPPENDE